MSIHKLLFHDGITKDVRQLTDLLALTDTNFEYRFALCKNMFLQAGFAC